MRTRHLVPGMALAVALSISTVAAADDGAPSELAVLRNTVVNMLQAMVARGLITREAADELVAGAQRQAAAEQDTADVADPGDVRVTYVPEIVKDEIREAIRRDLGNAVATDVRKAAREEGWGVPAALPDWIRRATWSGDIRLRGESTLYDNGNPPFFYRDFQAINDAGGEGRAGADAFLNTTENQTRFQVKVNIGARFDLGPNSLAAIRIGSGNTGNPVTRNQTLGSYGSTSPVLLEEAWLRLGTGLQRSEHQLAFWAGRTPNLLQSSELLWDNDVRFNGFTAQYAWKSLLGEEAAGLFATVGAYSIQEIELDRDDKWLLAAQLGYQFDVTDAIRLSVAAAYYDYLNIVGRRNAPDSTLLDYTAPRFLQKGNTLFDIRNDTDPDTNLYALAADYNLVNLNANGTWLLRPDMELEISAAYVTNTGYDEQEILGRTGVFVPEKADAYRLQLETGNPEIGRRGAWRAFVAYHYAERDALLDAFTDSDIHRGGTDAEGYVLGAEIGIAEDTWLRARYLTADEMDGLPLGIDVLQLDLNARF